MTREITLNVDPAITRVFVVRHGRTDYNSKKIMQGHLDIDINDDGRLQAQKVGEYFKDIEIDYIITSDLIRCVNTIRYVTDLHPNIDENKIRTTKNFRERNMGPVEGMHIQDAIDKYGPNFKNIGEQASELHERLNLEWDLLLKNATAEDYKNIVVCTHGGVITGFTNHLYDSKNYLLAEGMTKSNLKVPYNTSVTVIDVEKKTGKGIIQKFGLTEHLGGQFEVQNQLLR